MWVKAIREDTNGGTWVTFIWLCAEFRIVIIGYFWIIRILILLNLYKTMLIFYQFIFGYFIIYFFFVFCYKTFIIESSIKFNY